MITRGELFGGVLSLLGRALDFRAERQNLLSTNLAHVDTPNYQAKDLEFEEALRGAVSHGSMPMARTSPGHLGGGPIPPEEVTAEVVEREDVPTRPDGNTVDIDREMSRLTENSLLYSAGVETLRRLYGLIKYAINEGGR
ncbi:MAG: flagellar basal body rod protein FlgB [Nitrospinota bacterium]